MLKGGIKEKDMVSVNIAKSLLETVVKERKEKNNKYKRKKKYKNRRYS